MTKIQGLNEFKETFEESREAFLELADKSGGELRTHQVSPDLVFDSLYFSPKGTKKRLLILTSGIHGIEGFAGSALQRYFIQRNFFNMKDETTGVLIIHGINPHGFKHCRRVTENNVDLNRNFDTSPELFKTLNPGYSELTDFLNPAKRYSRFAFLLSAIRFIQKYGVESMRKAILRGQYEFPRGVFFGGKKFEPQVQLIQNEVLKRGDGYQEVVLVDLHTGYGEKGKLHLLGDPSPFLDERFMRKVFGNLPIVFGQDKEFYSISGGLTLFLAKLFHGKAQFAGVVFEFGTLKRSGTLGALDSLYRMVNENQRDKNEGDRELFKEMFYPKSLEWRSGVVLKFEDVIKKLF